MKSSILDAVHGTVKGLHESGVLKKETLREFNALCLPQMQE